MTGWMKTGLGRDDIKQQTEEDWKKGILQALDFYIDGCYTLLETANDFDNRILQNMITQFVDLKKSINELSK